ncbi:DNA translocase FtsK [Pasteurella sp. PK-2025]|uniref:DNA translocase FtsK n=1 Tax=unclassified Pasteurella TaxID=2621516 RepID=UPI003C73A7EE
MTMKLSEQLLETELAEQVKNFVIARCYASISEVQRQFKLGFNRAARIVDKLESQGVIAPMNEEGVRLSLIVTDTQQSWWNALPEIWKKVFITHLYYKQRIYSFDMDWYHSLSETELREKTDLIHVLSLKRINIIGDESVTTLPDLSIFPCLQSLTVRNTGIRDVSQLADCEPLVFLDLAMNQIEDIQPLLQLSCLERLNLTGNPIADHQLEMQIMAACHQRREENKKYRKILEGARVQMEKYYDC